MLHRHELLSSWESLRGPSPESSPSMRGASPRSRVRLVPPADQGLSPRRRTLKATGRLLRTNSAICSARTLSISKPEWVSQNGPQSSTDGTRGSRSKPHSCNGYTRPSESVRRPLFLTLSWPSHICAAFKSNWRKFNYSFKAPLEEKKTSSTSTRLCSPDEPIPRRPSPTSTITSW